MAGAGRLLISPEIRASGSSAPPRPLRVSLFATCLGDHFFAEALADTVRLLRHLGVEVDVPAGQSCCGQPPFNSGYLDEARKMARSTLAVLDGQPAVVAPSGSCAAMIRHHYPRILRDTDMGDAADALAARTWELAEFLVDVMGVEHLGSGLTGSRVAVHHGCHGLRDLGVRSQSVQLLQGGGAEVVEWSAAEECCGFGGTISAKMSAVSVAMADRKLDTLPAVDVLTSSDPGCLLQLAGRARNRARSRTPEIPVRHIASLLWEAVDAGH